MAGKHYSDKQRAQAFAYLMLRYSARETAKAVGITLSEARSLQADLDSRRSRARNIGGNENALDFGPSLNEEVAACLKQLTLEVKAQRDPEWLKTRSARQIAALYSKSFNKLIRAFKDLE